MLENKVSKYQSVKVSMIAAAAVMFFIYSSAHAQEQQFTYDSKGRRNPFIPLVTAEGRLLQLDKEEAKGDLSVEGIIFDKRGRSYAIVNGQVVGIGDGIAGYEVLKIENNKVIFIKESKITEIEIHKEGE